MNILYVNNRNEKIDLSDFPFCIQEPETILGHNWAYTSIESYTGNSVITQFRHQIKEKKFRISIWADNRADFSEKLTRLIELFDYDVINGKTGKLYCNDSYLNCYIIASEPSEFEEDFWTTEQTFTMVAENPMWITEKSFIFNSVDATDIGFEYSYEYPFEYHLPATGSGSVENSGMPDCDFRLTINGPITNPEVTIGGHLYGVIASAGAGEYIEIDSKEKTVKKVGDPGQNLFNNRVKESDVFRKIPAGINEVAWTDDINFEIQLFEERSCASW